MPNIIENVIRGLDNQSDTDHGTEGRQALSRAVRKYAAAVADKAKAIEMPEGAASPLKRPSSQVQERLC